MKKLGATLGDVSLWSKSEHLIYSSNYISRSNSLADHSSCFLFASHFFFQTWKWCPSRYAGASHSVFGTEVLESPNSFKFSSSCWIMGGWLEIESLEAGKLEQHHKGWICFGSICPCRNAGSLPPGLVDFLRGES